MGAGGGGLAVQLISWSAAINPHREILPVPYVFAPQAPPTHQPHAGLQAEDRDEEA